MAVIVEDGTVVAGAESYVSVDDADTYHAARGNTAWSEELADATKEAALRSACEYLDNNYSWKGTKTAGRGQSLEWPRFGVSDCDGFSIAYNEIPQEIKYAQMELALRAISAPLITDISANSMVKREKVDVLEVEYFSGQNKQSVYTAAENYIRCLINWKSGGGLAMMVQG